MEKLLNRMLRAAKLETGVYEELEQDATATRQALLVVLVVAVLAGIGTLTTQGALPFLSGLVGGVVLWAVAAYVTFFLGTKLLAEPSTHASWGQMARTLGFAYSPGVLYVFAIIPVLGGLIALAALVWVIVAWVVAVRQALDYTSTVRAVVVVIVGYIISAIVTAIVLLPLNALA